MATPSAAPIWRVASFTAEPTPARDGGSEPITASVAEAIAMPIPTPTSDIPASHGRYPSPAALTSTSIPIVDHREAGADHRLGADAGGEQHAHQ